MGVEGILKCGRLDHKQDCDCFATISLTEEYLKTNAVITAVQYILSMMITLEVTPTQDPRRNPSRIKGCLLSSQCISGDSRSSRHEVSET